MADDIVNLPTPEETAQAASDVQPLQVPQAPSQAVAPQGQTPTSESHVNVINPEGQLVSIPQHQLSDAVNSGYSPASNEQVAHHERQQKYGTTDQQLKTLAEGAASSATFGLSTAVERGLGVKPEDIQGRREVNPGEHMVGQVAGLFSPTGAGAMLGKAGQGAAKLAGLAEPATTLAKIGSSAVKGAVETGLFQSGDEVSKMFSGQTPLTSEGLETAMTDIGLSGLTGGALSGAFGVVSPLWKATIGSKVGQTLQTIANKAGGIEGAIPDSVHNAIAKTGMEIAPEIRSGLSNDPEMQQMFKTLEQSDTTKSGRELQKTYQDFRNTGNKVMVESLGKDMDRIESSELSKYEAGKKIGNTLADEYAAKMEPIAKQFDDIRSKYSKIELPKDSSPLMGSDIPGTPGVTSKVIDDIAQLADREGWTTSPSSDIMKQVNNIMQEIPLQKTVKNLSDYISRVSDIQRADPLNGPMRRAMGMIKGILKDAEADTIGAQIGAKEGAEAYSAFKQAREAYRQQGILQESLDSRLHARGNVSSYAKSIREMAQTDGESIARRLSGAGDADLLKTIETNFPKTAQAIKSYHIDNLIQSAMDKAKPGDTINGRALIKAVSKMSPELRQFAVPQAAIDKIDAVSKLLDQFDRHPHNFSNTARTIDKLMEYVPASALGMTTMLLGHNPALAALVSLLTKQVGKDIPDAMRLSILKFMGSGKPVDAGGFGAMSNLIHSTMKGQQMVAKATKNVFKAGREVLPESRIPTESDRAKLDKAVKMAQTNPEKLQGVGGEIGHYLPDHAIAIGALSATTLGYLNTLRPSKESQSPLDAPMPPNPMQKAQYNRALDIAEQPLMVMKHVQQGTLTPQDVVSLKTMYPNLYNKLVQGITEEMGNHVSKGNLVPYQTRIGLSMLMAQPLDSTLTPQNIMAAQPKPEAQPSQQMGKPQRSTGKIGSKTIGNAMTSSQAAEKDSQTRK